MQTTLERKGTHTVEHAVIVNGRVEPNFKALKDETGNRTWSVVSKNYGVVNNKTIIDTIEEGTGLSLVMYRFNEKNSNTRMVFETQGDWEGLHLDILGDIYKPQIEVTNSYNGQHAITVQSRLLRLVCLNGMRVWDQDTRFSTPHTRFAGLRFEREAMVAYKALNSGTAYRMEKALSKPVSMGDEIDELFQKGILSNRQLNRLKVSPEPTLNPEHHGKLNELIQALTGPFIPKGEALEETYYATAQRAVQHLMVKHGK